ncbi:MAG: choice-of-anchor D domain-containing protein, partial [Bryobacteraceae bacterium]|nr:choice-of-anchor D domain-containing protein [Bryobacteraceae bacterium]
MDQAAVRLGMLGGMALWFAFCTVLQGQPAPVTALSPSVLQGAPGVTTDTSGLGTIRITHAGSSGFVSMELNPTLSVVPCPQGGGSCLAPTEVRVRHTLSGLRQVSILVDGSCNGPTGFGFVANQLFTCPVSAARLDDQDRISVRALITLQRAVGDPTPAINVLFNWQVAVACPAADAAPSKHLQPRAACAATDVTITPSVVSNDPSGPYARADIFGNKLTAVIRGKNLPFDIDGTPVVTLDGVFARVTSSTREEIVVDLNGFGNLPEGPRDLEIAAGGVRSRTPNAFFVSSIALKEIEINQGVPLKCEPTRPCVAEHPTVVRIHTECNGTKTDGTSCEAGKQAAIGAFYITSGGSTRTLAPGAFQMARAGVAPDSERKRLARDTGNYYFSGRTGEGALLPEGTMSVVYAIDPRNPNAALTAAPDPNKHLILKSADFVFRRSTRKIRVGMMVDSFQVNRAALPARINPATVLTFIDYIRGAYPVASTSVEATIIPTDLSFNPPNSEDGPVDHFIARILRPMFHTYHLPLDYLVFLTANPALQTPGASDCGKGWISDWRCLSGAFMVKLNGAETMKALAHEIGHNHMLGDSYSADREHDPQVNAGLPAQKQPVALCEFFHDGCPAQLNHMDLLTREVSLGPPFTLPITDFGTQQRLVKRDFMGNASRAHSWTNQFNWNHLYDNYYMTGAGQQDALEEGPSAPLLDVSGSFGRDDAVEFYSISRREGAAPELPAGAQSPYVIEIQSGTSEVLFSAPMDVIVTFADRIPATSRAGFRELIPLPAGAARVVIKKDGGVIGSRELSANAPSVGFVSPSAGTSLDGLVTIRWTGSDADNDPLSYSLLFSSDGGNIWAPLVMGTDATTYSWDTAAWPGGTNLMLRIAASDGVNSAEATLSGLRLPAKAPQIAIVTPVDGASLNKADQPELSVSVWDPQEGALDPNLVVIRSDRDGEIAKGLSADLSRLSPGRHRITAAATNRSNLTGEAVITVTISGGGAGAPPVIVAAPAEIDFGNVTLGQSAVRSAAIRNDGGERLTVSQISVPGPAFSLTATGMPWILDPGQSREYQVRFSPTGAGRLTALISIASDDPARRTITVALSGAGVATPGGGVGGTLEKITPLRARGWPNERTFDNPPPNAVDGNTNTFTWTTNPNNIASPSYFGADFGASKPVSRIRLYKDNDGGGGTLSDHFKNLVIEYTTTNASTPLPERTWTRVTGLANGFNGTE